MVARKPSRLASRAAPAASESRMAVHFPSVTPVPASRFPRNCFRASATIQRAANTAKPDWLLVQSMGIARSLKAGCAPGLDGYGKSWISILFWDGKRIKQKDVKVAKGEGPPIG